ncbi:MAG: hypothetical protein QGH45_17540 [Myxococcota bacterium]|nr:hypothetical protein [Myxococcota bacterium]
MTRAAARQLEQLDALDIAGKSVDKADFAADLAVHGWDEIQPAVLDVFQINLGRVCNMSCKHCHVDAGSGRTEQMDDDVLEACLRAVDRGGSPSGTSRWSPPCPTTDGATPTPSGARAPSTAPSPRCSGSTRPAMARAIRSVCSR